MAIVIGQRKVENHFVKMCGGELEDGVGLKYCSLLFFQVALRRDAFRLPRPTADQKATIDRQERNMTNLTIHPTSCNAQNLP